MKNSIPKGKEILKMKQFIVDAFTNEVFHGNQAAVCVLDEWLSEEMMMNITKGSSEVRSRSEVIRKMY